MIQGQSIWPQCEFCTSIYNIAINVTFSSHCSSALLFGITRLISPWERIENHLYINERTNVPVFSERTWTLIQQPLFRDFKKCLRNFYFNFWVICFDFGCVLSNFTLFSVLILKTNEAILTHSTFVNVYVAGSRTPGQFWTVIHSLLQSSKYGLPWIDLKAKLFCIWCWICHCVIRHLFLQVW